MRDARRRLVLTTAYRTRTPKSGKESDPDGSK
jgi:hypothetical protein